MTEEEKKQYHEKVDENIRKFGQHITFVLEGKCPSFCYSTGIFETYNIPEIFISSLPQNLSYELVKGYVEMFKESTEIPLNTKIDALTDRFPIYLIEVPISNLNEYALSSIRYYHNKVYKCLQMIYPDTQGRFPNDNGYDYDQEILGEFKN